MAETTDSVGIDRSRGGPSPGRHPRAGARPGAARTGRTATALCALAALGASLAVAVEGPPASAAPAPPGLRVHQLDAGGDDDVALAVSPPRALSLVDLRAADLLVSGAGGPIPFALSPRPAAELDVAVVVELGSSREQRRATLAATDELVRTLPAGAHIALAAVAGATPLVAPLTDDRAQVLRALAGAEEAGGSGLEAALREGGAQLRTGTGSRPTLIVVAPRPLEASTLEDVDTEVPPSTASFVASTGPGSTEIDDVVGPTGGRAVAVARDGLLISATDQITRELGSQYRLDLESPPDPDTQVTVAVARDGVEAETETTLFADPFADPSSTGSAAPSAEGDALAAPGSALGGSDDSPRSWAPLVAGILGALALAGGATGAWRARRRAQVEGDLFLAAPRAGGALRPDWDAVVGSPSALTWDYDDLPRSDPGTPTPAVIDLRHPDPRPAVIDLRDPAPPAEDDGEPPTRAEPTLVGPARDRGSGSDEPPVVPQARALVTARLRPALPARHPLETSLAPEVARAEAAVAELDDLVRSQPEEVLLDAFVLREAVASTNQSGGDISLVDMFRSRAGLTPADPMVARAVERHVDAVLWGFDQARSGHLGRSVRAGVVRRRGRSGPELDPPPSIPSSRPPSPGSPTSASLRAVLAGQDVDDGGIGLPSWLGRATVLLSLGQDGALSAPIVDLSWPTSSPPAPVGTARPDPLRSLRTSLDTLTSRSGATQRRLEALVGLRASYQEVLAQGRPGPAPVVVDLVLANPVVTVRLVADRIGLTQQAALQAIRHMRHEGWLVEDASTVRARRRYWVAPEVLTVHEGPPR